MRHLIKRHTISFSHALDGLRWAWKTQPNYRIHTFFSSMVVGAGFFFNVHPFEWIFLIMTITIGLVIETLNTALEATSDAITKDWKEEIKIAKDAAAAAMLTYAIGAITVAAIIFIPKML